LTTPPEIVRDSAGFTTQLPMLRLEGGVVEGDVVARAADLQPGGRRTT
jgi:hypothetical protein